MSDVNYPENFQERMSNLKKTGVPNFFSRTEDKNNDYILLNNENVNYNNIIMGNSQEYLNSKNNLFTSNVDNKDLIVNSQNSLTSYPFPHSRKFSATNLNQNPNISYGDQNHSLMQCDLEEV